MQKNVGTIDRYVRIIIGTSAIAVGVYLPSWWGALGIIPLLTAFVGWCPAYSFFGMNSCRLFSSRDTCRADGAP